MEQREFMVEAEAAGQRIILFLHQIHLFLVQMQVLICGF